MATTRHYHFSYDVKDSSKWKNNEERKFLIKLFFKECKCSDVVSFQASAMILSFDGNHSDLFTKIHKALNDDFYFTCSHCAFFENGEPVMVNNPDTALAKNFNDLKKQVKKEITTK